MRYPQIVFFRHEKYAPVVDAFIAENKDKWMCTFHIVGEGLGLNKLFHFNTPVLVTYGESYNEYLDEVHSIIAPRMISHWLHYKDITDIDHFNNDVNNCYMSIVVRPKEEVRVAFSLFTTCYESYDKIRRAYNSIQTQTFKDWEWVILDDSPTDAHFSFLRALFMNDKRVRLYRRSENSGNIGNVKNEAVSLCRGKYVLEMDHDDEILEDCLKDAVFVFEKDPDVGFVYMNFTNVYEDGSNFSYGDFFGLGYSGYHFQKIKDSRLCGGNLEGKWVKVAMTPNINNITLTHIVAVPNHPRIWRKSVLMAMGNYSEFLPICDDYELLIRTAVNTKMAKINKLAYVQYMNNGNSNFSLMWNAEISRLGPQYIKPHAYLSYKVEEKMEELGASESDTFSHNKCQMWKRAPEYSPTFCNSLETLKNIVFWERAF
jgi:glycosyltransferase involved in cell wall biosynthesis